MLVIWHKQAFLDRELGSLTVGSVCSLLETDREVFVVPGGAESGMGHGAHGSSTDEEVVQAMMHEPHLIVRYSTYCTVNFFEKIAIYCELIIVGRM